MVLCNKFEFSCCQVLSESENDVSKKKKKKKRNTTKNKTTNPQTNKQTQNQPTNTLCYGNGWQDLTGSETNGHNVRIED